MIDMQLEKSRGHLKHGTVGAGVVVVLVVLVVLFDAHRSCAAIGHAKSPICVIIISHVDGMTLFGHFLIEAIVCPNRSWLLLPSPLVLLSPWFIHFGSGTARLIRLIPFWRATGVLPVPSTDRAIRLPTLQLLVVNYRMCSRIMC